MLHSRASPLQRHAIKRVLGQYKLRHEVTWRFPSIAHDQVLGSHLHKPNLATVASSLSNVTRQVGGNDMIGRLDPARSANPNRPDRSANPNRCELRRPDRPSPNRCCFDSKSSIRCEKLQM
jgi:hypothetical protein